MDTKFNNDEWKKSPECRFYDVNLIHKVVTKLKKHRKDASLSRERAKHALHEIKQVLLHGGCKANLGGVENEALYSYTYLGTKDLVEIYVSEVVESLQLIADSPLLSDAEKKTFFEKANFIYGRSALCLSGGAVGVVKALFEQNMLPNVIAGTSAGALLAANICVRTDTELQQDLLTPDFYKIINVTKTISWYQRFKNLYQTGSMFEFEDWYQKCINLMGGNYTFFEAYEKTGRILNISVVPDEPHAPNKLLNYITAPDVLIASAVIASSAIPGIVPAVELLQKTSTGKIIPFHGSGHKWRDGSLTTDIPERELHLLFDVTYTIVSQANPHIILFFYERNGSAGMPSAHRSGRGWRGGFIGSALTQHFKLDLQKWVQLVHDLNLVPTIQKSDISRIFLQKFEGNVTIVPTPSWQDYWNVLEDPGEVRMKRYLEIGQRIAWPKLVMIGNRMKIELTLQRLAQKYAGIH